MADPSMIPDNHDGLMFVEGMGKSWLVDISAKNIANGRWLISIDGAMDVFNVIRLPGNKVRLSNDSAEFECNLSDITPSGTVILQLRNIYKGFYDALIICYWITCSLFICVRNRKRRR